MNNEATSKEDTTAARLRYRLSSQKRDGFSMLPGDDIGVGHTRTGQAGLPSFLRSFWTAGSGDYLRGGEQCQELSRSSWTRHMLSRGHVGKINSVATSETVDILVTGGEDYTMRMWGYDEATHDLDLGTISAKREDFTQSYDLHAVLLHDHEREMDAVTSSFVSVDLGWADQLAAAFSRQQEYDYAVFGVTAVACAGSRGPIISGTAHGGLYVCQVSGQGWTQRIQKNGGKVNDICVEGGTDAEGRAILGSGPANGGRWNFAAACEDGLVIVHSEEGRFAVKHVAESHTGPVQKVRHIRHVGKKAEADWISLASSSEDQVCLWSWGGECKNVIQNIWRTPDVEGGYMSVGDGPSFTMLATGNTPCGTLLFAGNARNGSRTTSAVSGWVVENGELCDGYGSTCTSDWDPQAPVVTYLHCGEDLDLDSSGNFTAFAADRRDHVTISVWNLQGVSPGRLAIPPRGPANWLVAPNRGMNSIMLELPHDSEVRCFRTADDPDDACGPACFVGCKDGSAVVWDLEGVDSGEAVARIRSLTKFEIALPIIFMLVTFLQVISFAFGPQTDWPDVVDSTVGWSTQITLFEIDDFVKVQIPNITAEDWFWRRTQICVYIMIFYLLFTLLPLQVGVDWVVHNIRASEAYNVKTDILHTATRSLTYAVSFVRSIVHLILGICATLGVVPIFKGCARAMDCVHEDPPLYKTYGGVLAQILFGGTNRPEGVRAPYLSEAHSITCFEGDHRFISVVLLFLVPVYFVALIPLAVVEGDPNYVSYIKFWNGLYQGIRSMLLLENPTTNYWKLAAQRQSTVVNQGFLHPFPRDVCVTRFADLVAKMCLPVVVIETSRFPRFQMILVTLIGLIMFVSTLVFRRWMSMKIRRFDQGIRFFTLCTMSCGCLTTLTREDAIWPQVVAGVCALIVPVVVYILIQRQSTPTVLVQVFRTSEMQKNNNNNNANNGSKSSHNASGNEQETKLSSRKIVLQ